MCDFSFYLTYSVICGVRFAPLILSPFSIYISLVTNVINPGLTET